MAKTANVDLRLTNMVGQPGLSITSADKEGGEDVFHGFYIPSHPPFCLECDCKAGKNGFTPKERCMCDIIGTGEKQRVITLLIRQQRYVCPQCKKSVPYGIPFIDSRVSTTNRLNEHIIGLCLDNSADKVSLMLKDKISKSKLWDIFEFNARKRIENYKQNVAAPVTMGIHRISVFQNDYFVLTNLENRTIIDVYNKETLPQMNRLLMKLTSMGRTTTVFSAMEPECMIPARSVRRASVSAAICSLFRLCSAATLTAIESYKESGHRIVKEWLAFPLYDSFDPDLPCKRALDQMGARKPYLRDCVSIRENLRTTVIPDWKSKTYEPWRLSVLQNHSFRSLSDLLDDEKPEIYTSFGADLTDQSLYSELERLIASLIYRSQKCTFEILRARLLLSMGPERMRVRTGTGVNYYYAGVSVDDLVKKLKPFNS